MKQTFRRLPANNVVNDNVSKNILIFYDLYVMFTPDCSDDNYSETDMHLFWHNFYKKSSFKHASVCFIHYDKFS